MTSTPGDKTAGIKLEPGERRAANGVIIGSGAHPEVPRFGQQDEAPWLGDPDRRSGDDVEFCDEGEYADEADDDWQDIPGAQDAGWAAYWATKPKFRDGE
jgi:hypothetical protein